MELVIISGRSGSGKSTALHQLEDEGYYCIDNLPVSLLPDLVKEVRRDPFQHFRGAAVCIDARNAWKDLARFDSIMGELPEALNTTVLYLDADDNALIKRFSETRRKHPLSSETLPLADAIDRERDLLEPLASAASLVLDSSQMTIYELRDAIRQRVVGNAEGEMSILIQSFGFKRGLPNDADLIYDLRCLPNPHWVKSLRVKNGLDADVAEFLENQPLTGELFNDISTYLKRWLPEYANSNRSYMTVALGCTGGQHRSVYMADRLYKAFKSNYPHLHVRHRELQP
ncbi:MAG: RNase adapter RapZ [Halieaceae bacterium]|nr:RNase adapter RapZ [Halieaceae bacterium]